MIAHVPDNPEPITIGSGHRKLTKYHFVCFNGVPEVNFDHKE